MCPCVCASYGISPMQVLTMCLLSLAIRVPFPNQNHLTSSQHDLICACPPFQRSLSLSCWLVEDVPKGVCLEMTGNGARRQSERCVSLFCGLKLLVEPLSLQLQWWNMRSGGLEGLEGPVDTWEAWMAYLTHGACDIVRFLSIHHPLAGG